MNFDSAFFLFCFLPPLFLLYYAVRSARARNVILLAAGLLFYSFGGAFDLLVLLLMGAATWGAGELIRRGRMAKAALVAGVGLNVAVLVFFKAIERVAVTLTGPDPGMRLFFARVSPVALSAPLGISFFAFKCISYIVDVHRDRENAGGSFFSFLTYVSFFPEIVSGPISRYRDFAPQTAERRATASEIADGLARMIRGLGKKLLISGAAGAVANAVFGFQGTPDIRLAWVGAVSYALQLFFDFSGYSDMAIGLAGVFGFVSPENFNYPYTAYSIKDFWRRWHMSLSGWLRDYVYIPLGGSRRGKYRAAVNRLTVFLVCGLWHGFGLTYLIWGAWHGLLSAAEGLKLLDVERWRKNKAGAVLCHIYTLLAVIIGFVMFRAGSAGQGFAMIGAMFAGFDLSRAGTALLAEVLNGRSVFLMAVGAILCAPLADIAARHISEKWRSVLRYGACAALFALCLMSLAAGGFSPFIYASF